MVKKNKPCPIRINPATMIIETVIILLITNITLNRLAAVTLIQLIVMSITLK